MVLSLSPVFSWTHSAEELRPSSNHPGTYDQPEAAISWLKAFRSLNSHFTSQVHTYSIDYHHSFSLSSLLLEAASL